MPELNQGSEPFPAVRPGATPIDTSLTTPVGQPDNNCAPVGTQTDIPANPNVPGISVPVDPDAPGGTKEKFNWLDPAYIAQLCTDGLSPRAVDQILWRVLVSHFVDPDNLFNQDLDYLVFNENQAQGTIRIAMNTTFDATAAERLPALIIKRGQQESRRIVIGDLASTPGVTSNERRYVRRLIGSHQIMIISAVDGEVEALSLEVLDLLTCVSPVLVSLYPFGDFQVAGLSEMQLMSQVGNKYGVMLGMQYQYEYGWSVTVDNGAVTGFSINGQAVAV